MKTLICMTAIAALALLSTPVMASPPSKPCTSAAEKRWMKIANAEKILVKAGYDVRRMKVAMNCFEAYVIDKSGNMLELFLDPVSGKVVETKKN